jgi:hypothetical protein
MEIVLRLCQVVSSPIALRIALAWLLAACGGAAERSDPAAELACNSAPTEFSGVLVFEGQSDLIGPMNGHFERHIAGIVVEQGEGLPADAGAIREGRQNDFRFAGQDPAMSRFTRIVSSDTSWTIVTIGVAEPLLTLGTDVDVRIQYDREMFWNPIRTTVEVRQAGALTWLFARSGAVADLPMPAGVQIAVAADSCEVEDLCGTMRVLPLVVEPDASAPVTVWPGTPGFAGAFRMDVVRATEAIRSGCGDWIGSQIVVVLRREPVKI